MQTKVVNPKEVKAKGKRAKARTLCPCHKNCVANAIEMQPGTQFCIQHKGWVFPPWRESGREVPQGVPRLHEAKVQHPHSLVDHNKSS